jgi:hypothetical protein
MREGVGSGSPLCQYGIYIYTSLPTSPLHASVGMYVYISMYVYIYALPVLSRRRCSFGTGTGQSS